MESVSPDGPLAPPSAALPRLGIVAGSGELPRRILSAVASSGRDCFVLAIEGETEKALIQNVPHAWVRLGAIGQSVKILKSEGVEELVLAGKISKPNLSSLRPDFGAAKLLARIGTSRLAGDNAVLSTVVKFLEEQGFKVVGVENILAEVLAPEGTIGSIEPDEGAWSDIRHGIKIALATGEMDIGQAVIVQMGRVLAVEAAEGTDAMINRSRELALEGEGGVLVKVKKPNQEARVDLPTIGLNTVINCFNAGLRGIAVEAGGSIMIDREEVAKKADELGLFVIGVRTDAK